MTLLEQIQLYAACWFIGAAVGWPMMVLRLNGQAITRRKMVAVMMVAGWTGVVFAILWARFRIYYAGYQPDGLIMEQIVFAILSGASEKTLLAMSQVCVRGVTGAAKRILGVTNGKADD